MEALPRLYGIADRRFGDPVDIGRRLFAGGARLVQIRDKRASSRRLLEGAQALVGAAPEGASVVVNDRSDVALLAGARGVHLGQGDLPAPRARLLLGPDALVGVSTHNVDQARIAQDWPVDYLAAGPVFPTASRETPDPPIGLEGLGAICGLSRLPVVAIGGIRLEGVAALLVAGAASVAAIADLLGEGDIERRTRRYIEVLESIR